MVNSAIRPNVRKARRVPAVHSHLGGDLPIQREIPDRVYNDVDDVLISDEPQRFDGADPAAEGTGAPLHQLVPKMNTQRAELPLPLPADPVGELDAVRGQGRILVCQAGDVPGPAAAAFAGRRKGRVVRYGPRDPGERVGDGDAVVDDLTAWVLLGRAVPFHAD